MVHRIACEIADTPWRRLRGLIGRPVERGLMLEPCRAIHTCFMRRPIDVLFIDERRTVLAVHHEVPPRRTRAERRARAVVELPAGAAAAAGIAPGDRIVVQS
ncbi:MAG TPA: DUF192 domain-containing protein [Thermoleophilaceae bacterium]|nr:DUF192 domain-containing protein [Thermoleophilaceae bacterium]